MIVTATSYVIEIVSKKPEVKTKQDDFDTKTSAMSSGVFV